MHEKKLTYALLIMQNFNTFTLNTHYNEIYYYHSCRTNGVLMDCNN